MRYPTQMRSLARANCVANSCCEPIRIVSADREFFAIAQRDRYGIKARNIVEPAVRRQMNAPTTPPMNANWIASDNVRKPKSLADNANTKRGTESLCVDRNFESVEQNKADQQDDRHN